MAAADSLVSGGALVPVSPLKAAVVPSKVCSVLTAFIGLCGIVTPPCERLCTGSGFFSTVLTLSAALHCFNVLIKHIKAKQTEMSGFAFNCQLFV